MAESAEYKSASSTLSSAVKKHIRDNHMLPTAKHGKSFFTSTDESNVWKLVQETFKSPDLVVPHSSNVNRYILKKKFNVPTGRNGKTGSLCSCVTVVYDIEDQRIVTGYPTV